MGGMADKKAGRKPNEYLYTYASPDDPHTKGYREGYDKTRHEELDAETLDRAAQVAERPVVGYRDSTTNDNAPPTKCSIQDAT